MWLERWLSKSSPCSCRGPELDSQNPHWMVHNWVPVPRDSSLPFGLGVHLHTHAQRGINLKKLLRIRPISAKPFYLSHLYKVSFVPLPVWWPSPHPDITPKPATFNWWDMPLLSIRFHDYIYGPHSRPVILESLLLGPN